MLYLHCGWPRTATTSLQTALHRNRERLADAGIVYPEKWRSHTDNPTHHGLNEVLQPSPERRSEAADDLKRFLTAYQDEHVVLSAESLTVSLLVKSKDNGLPHLLEVAGDVTPVKCVWSLRRLDEIAISIYLLRLRRRKDFPPIETFLANRPTPDRLFDGMRGVEDAVARNVSYVRYEHDGAHLEKLLRACDIPDRPRDEILAELKGERLNGSLTHKQATTLLHRDILSERAGVELDFAALKNAFREGGFRFEDDRRFEPLSDDMRHSVQAEALEAARRQDFDPYIEFFGDAEIQTPPITPPDPDTITADDLERLMIHLNAVPAGAVGA